jgi:hypothetical protein
MCPDTGHITYGKVTVVAALVIVIAAFLLTTIYTARKIPTSTIQILVFCVVGMSLEAGIPVHWLTILKLVVYFARRRRWLLQSASPSFYQLSCPCWLYKEGVLAGPQPHI